MVVKRGYREIMMLSLTLHDWAAFRGNSIPSAVVEALPMSWAKQLVSIVAAVVGYRWWNIAPLVNLAIWWVL